MVKIEMCSVPGDSGSVLCDAGGRMVGIVSNADLPYFDTTYGPSTDEILKFLKDYETKKQNTSC